MKKYLNLNNLLTIGILIFVIVTQGPRVINNYKVNGIKLITSKVSNLETNEEIDLGTRNKVILFSWATWCAPCKLEMKRFKASVESGKIKKKDFLMINPFESDLEIKRFLNKNKYPFTFIDNGKVIADELKIEATPTITFVENSKVMNQSTGLSLIGIYRAEWFLE